jgi:hypothetical protein
MSQPHRGQGNFTNLLGECEWLAPSYFLSLKE